MPITLLPITVNSPAIGGCLLPFKAFIYYVHGFEAPVETHKHSNWNIIFTYCIVAGVPKAYKILQSFPKDITDQC